jgi:hypothetical protein
MLELEWRGVELMAMLPTGQLFGYIGQKGPNKVEQPNKFPAKLWPILNKKG